MRGYPADREFPVSVLHEPVGSGDDHCADSIRALDVTVVVDFDTVQLNVETEGSGDAVQQLALRGALGEAATECLARRSQNPAKEPLFVAALRHREPDPLASERQGLLYQLLLDQLVT